MGIADERLRRRQREAEAAEDRRWDVQERGREERREWLDWCTGHDIDADHATLKAAGVDVDAEVARWGDPVPPMFRLRDPSGNSLAIVEPTE